MSAVFLAFVSAPDVIGKMFGLVQGLDGKPSEQDEPRVAAPVA